MRSDKNLHWSCFGSFKSTEITESIGWMNRRNIHKPSERILCHVSSPPRLPLPPHCKQSRSHMPVSPGKANTTPGEAAHAMSCREVKGFSPIGALEPSLRMVDSNHRNRQYTSRREQNVWTRSETARARPPLKHTAVGVKARYKWYRYYILLYTAQSCTAEQHQCSLALHSCAMCYQSGTPTCAVSWHCCGTAQSSTRCSVHNGAPFPFQTGHAMCIVTKETFAPYLTC